MKYRFTVEEMSKPESPKYLNDLSFIRALIHERKGDCTNSYSPLYERLCELSKKIDKLIEHGGTNL